MSGKLHALAALTVAVALHLGAFAWRAPEAGATASGSGGEAMVSLEASSGSIAEMVDEWERPPEPVAEPVPQLPLELAQPEPPPQLTAPDVPETPLPVPTPLMALPQAPEMPSMDIAELPPPPPAEPAPEPDREPLPDTRPEPRPEPQPDAEPEPKPRAEPQPQRQPTPPPSNSVAERRAAGSGGGANAGASANAQAATNSQARATDLAKAWGASIRAQVERRAASVRGVDGASIEVQVSVSPAGGLLGVTMLQSSGNPALDAKVLKAVRSSRFPAAPAGLDRASYLFKFPIRFES